MKDELKFASLCLFFILVVGGSAASASLQPETTTATPAEPAYLKLFLIPEEKTNYSITVDGPGSVTIAPKKLSIDGDENKTVNIWFRPFKTIQPGKYFLVVEVKSSKGVVETLKPLVKVENNHRMKLLNYSKPECGDRRSSITVKNTGFSTQNLEITTGGVTVETLKLKPREKKEAVIELKDPVFKIASVGSYASITQEVDFPDCGSQEPFTSKFFSNPSNLALSIPTLLIITLAILQYTGRVELRELREYVEQKVSR